MEEVGLVGSPSTTGKITVDIVEGAVSGALLGQLVALPHRDEAGHIIAIGTVSEIETRNRWHEDQNMRGVLKQHGALPHLSAVGDVRTATMLVQAAYRSTDENPSAGDPPTESGAALPMSPTTGRPVIRVTDAYLDGLLRRHKSDTLFLGYAYNMDEVRLPLTIRHFGSVETGGAGEAYHSGIFGMTGSGKSVFAAYVLAAQLRHSDLAIILMDPQGQFTSEDLPFSLDEWAMRYDREVQRYSVSRDISLPKDANLLVGLLQNARFLRDTLTIKAADNQESAEAEFARILREQAGWERIPSKDLLKAILSGLADDDQALKRIYASKTSRERLADTIKLLLANDEEMRIALRTFAPLHSLFSSSGRKPLRAILHDLLESEHRPFVIINVSASRASEGEMLLESTSVKAQILRIICRHLVLIAEEAYRKRRALNTLVVFDEAQKFAASDPEEDEARALAERLVDYVRTTRKYGIGWMFITQEASALRRSIYNQLRFRAFGYGLTSGSELQRLRETIGDPAALDLYRSFVDPAAATPRRYPFMLQGPISPLTFTGAPLFLSVYTDFERFKSDNGFS